MPKQNTPLLITISIAAISLLAVGCFNSRSNDLQRPSVSTNEQNDLTSNGDGPDEGQVAGTETVQLPTKTIKIKNNIVVQTEVADTDAARTQGLSGREKLNDNTGMLFDFTNTDVKKPGFWMKDMLINIDIVWIKDGMVVGIEPNLPLPPEDGDLPVYYPPSDITHVLEVPAGWTAKSNVKVGDPISL